MPETRYLNRHAYQVENDVVRVTVTVEGGHIAEILHKATGVNPLWIPPWPSIKPSSYDPQKHPEYGGGAESRLLAGIMGHNLCLDIFGGPSEDVQAQVVSHDAGQQLALGVLPVFGVPRRVVLRWFDGRPGRRPQGVHAAGQMGDPGDVTALHQDGDPQQGVGHLTGPPVPIARLVHGTIG